MKKNRQPLIDDVAVRHRLFNMISSAGIESRMLAALSARFSDKGFQLLANRLYGEFFASIFGALYTSVIVTLYKLMENRTDSVNFNQLIRMLPPSTNADLTADIDSRLASLKEIFDQHIYPLRNKTVGHLSIMDNTNRIVLENSIPNETIQRYLAECRELGRILALAFHDVDFQFADYTAESFEKMVDDLMEFNKDWIAKGGLLPSPDLSEFMD